MGLISRVSSRTYRFYDHKNMAKGDKFGDDIADLLKYVCREDLTGSIPEIKHIYENLASIQNQHKNRTNQKNNDSYEIKQISLEERKENLQILFKNCQNSVKNIDKIELIEQFGDFGLKKIGEVETDSKIKSDLRVPKSLM